MRITKGVMWKDSVTWNITSVSGEAFGFYSKKDLHPRTCLLELEQPYGAIQSGKTVLWVEGCGIKSLVWNYLLILLSSQPTGLCVCTRLKCTLIWRGGSHLGLGLSRVTDETDGALYFQWGKTSNPLPCQNNQTKDIFVTGRMLVRSQSRRNVL